jgi:hypothetical protein
MKNYYNNQSGGHKMLKQYFWFMILAAVFSIGLATAADLTDIVSVTGDTVKTIDGSLGDWAGSEKILERSDFIQFAPWKVTSDADAITDIYASYAGGHLYLGVQMDHVNTDTELGGDGTGIEVFIKVNLQQEDVYCLQAVAQIDSTIAQQVLLYQPEGVTDESDADGSVSSFLGGVVVQAHELVSSPDVFFAEFDFDIQAIADLSGGLDLVDGDTVSVCILPRGQNTRFSVYSKSAVIWGGDGNIAFDVGYLPIQNTRNDQQGFTGGLQIAIAPPVDCSQVQPSQKDAADLDGNCVVNMLDFVEIAGNWLGNCTNPNDVNCL